jgi:hypothetical protein
VNRLTRYGAAAIGAVALVGSVSGGIVLAQSGGGTSPTPSSGQTAPKDPKALRDDYIKRLAANLGVDEQTLRDALEQTSLDELEQAVTDGRIPADMAQKIRDAITSGDGTFEFGFGVMRGHGGPGGPGGPGFAMARGADLMGSLATFLGITPEELRTEIEAGQTPGQVVEAHGKTRDDAKAYLTGEANSQIQKEVDAGHLTSDQAQKMKDGLSDGIDHFLDSQPGPKGGFEGHGGPGFGGHRGPGGGPPPNGGAPAQPGSNQTPPAGGAGVN